MFDDADLLGPETDDVEQNFFAAGQFNDTVQIFYFKEILKIICGVYAEFFGKDKSFGLRVDIANTDDIDL